MSVRLRLLIVGVIVSCWAQALAYATAWGGR